MLSASVAHAGDAEWTTSGPVGGLVQELMFVPGNPAIAYATTLGGVYRSTDGGDTWNPADLGIVAEPAYPLDLALDAEQPGSLYTFDSWGRIYRSTDSGGVWAILPNALLEGVHPTAIADQPGTTCTVLLGTATPTLIGGPMLFKSIDCGLTYARIGTGLIDNASVQTIAIDPSNANHILVGLVGAGMQPLFQSTDGGQTFSATTLTASGNVDSISFGVDGDLWVVVDSYDVFHSNDGGATWTTPGQTSAYGVSVTADITQADRAWVASSDGVIRVDFDGSLYVPTLVDDGLTPNPTYTDGVNPVPTGVRRLTWRPGSTPRLFATTPGTGIFILDAAGTQWSPVTRSPTAVAVRALALRKDANGQNPRLWAGQSSDNEVSPALHRSNDDGASWSVTNNTLEAGELWSLLVDPTTSGSAATTVLYAGGHAAAKGNTAYYNFGLYRSDDGGASWTTLDGNLPIANSYHGTIRALALDPQSCTSPPCTPANGPLHRLYAVGHGRAPDDQLVFDQTHRVLRSDNRGTTWTDLSTNPGFPRSNYRINELTQRVTPTVLAVDPGNPQVLYVGTEAEFYDLNSSDAHVLDPSRESGLFKSTDQGQTWLRITGLPAKIDSANYPNASYDVVDLLIDPRNTNVLWLAMRDLFAVGTSTIFRSADSGATWNEFSSGLNGTLALQDLAFDPINPDVIYAAASGNGANPGAVYRGVWNDTNNSIAWLSISIGLPAEFIYTVAVDPLEPNLIHAGTSNGVYSMTREPDQDGDGAPDDVENQAPDAGGLPSGDGNGDNTADATQKDVGSSVIIFRRPGAAIANVTSAIDQNAPETLGTCDQAVDVSLIAHDQISVDLDVDGDPISHPFPARQFEILDCNAAAIDFTFHGANFSRPGWVFRFFGPLNSGNPSDFGWYDLPSATRTGPSTWRVILSADGLGSYRPETDAIRFIGSPACLDDRLTGDGFETDPTPDPGCAANP